MDTKRIFAIIVLAAAVLAFLYSGYDQDRRGVGMVMAGLFIIGAVILALASRGKQIKLNDVLDLAIIVLGISLALLINSQKDSMIPIGMSVGIAILGAVQLILVN